MADGRNYDHIGGGFARYSVDKRWLVPHFEKMLYDNAMALVAYSEAYRFFGNPRYKQIVGRDYSVGNSGNVVLMIKDFMPL